MSTKRIPVRFENAKLLAIGRLKPNDRNPNRHTPAQVERLAKLLEYQGWRHPIIVSNRSGLIVAGHGRLEAAKLLGLDAVPVDYQDFPSDEAEYAFLVSDNGIGEWSELDLAAINADLEGLGPDFDLEMLGLQDFSLDPSEKEGSKELSEDDFQNFKHTCPRCGFEFDTAAKPSDGPVDAE